MGNSKSQKFDGCPMDSCFIGLGLLRTVFKIAAACREGPAPDFCYIAEVIAGKISKNRFWPPRGQELYLEVEAWRAPYTSSVIYNIVYHTTE